MAENNINAYCSICGVGYTKCNSCSDQANLKPWKAVTDTVEHYKIFLALHGYTLSKNKENAKEELKRCDLSGLENFKPHIKSAIKEIMAENKKIKSVYKRKEETFEVEEDAKADVEVDVVAEENTTAETEDINE